MRYADVTRARFLERPNRFIALVELERGTGVDGETRGQGTAQSVERDAVGTVERVHVKNTGRCRELLVPGAVVYLARGTAPGRRTAYDLIAVEKETARGTLLINMDAQAPNAVFGEFAAAGRFRAAGLSEAAEPSGPSGPLGPTGQCTAAGPSGPLWSAGPCTAAGLSDVRGIRREAVWWASRLDFQLDTDHGPHLVEVKGVTLEQNGAASFPDAPTERGVKHLRELQAAVERGIAATVFFVIQMEGMTSFSPNDRTHPAFGAALREAAARGVDVQAWECAVTPCSLDIVRPVPVVL